MCATGSRADYVVTGGSIGNATFTPLESTIYVRKDIQLRQDSFISEFTNRHDEPPAEAPEPATLLLPGSSLTALGLAARRRRARIAV